MSPQWTDVSLYLSQTPREHKVQSRTGCPKAYLYQISTIKGNIVWSVLYYVKQSRCDWLSENKRWSHIASSQVKFRITIKHQQKAMSATGVTDDIGVPVIVHACL